MGLLPHNGFSPLPRGAGRYPGLAPSLGTYATEGDSLVPAQEPCLDVRKWLFLSLCAQVLQHPAL